MMLRQYILVSMIILLLYSTSQAGLIIDIYEQGNDVIVTGSGAISLTGLTQSSSGAFAGNFFWPSLAYLALRGPSDGSMLSYFGMTGPAEIGSGSVSFADAAISNYAFGFHGPSGHLYLDDGYLGDAIVFSQTHLNETFATLGLTPGTFVWSWPNDTIQVNIGDPSTQAPVPEPATMLLLGGGLAGLACIRCRVRRGIFIRNQ